MPSSDPTAPLSGPALLDAVTDAIVALHLRYYGRAPATAKTTRLGDDLLACTLGGIYTDVEKTMIELERADDVHDTRRIFQASTRHTYVDAVQRLSGRAVLASVSNFHVGPDLAVELFWLAPWTAAEPRASRSGNARSL
ncbi:Na-translocating system protein MpsC family protein [Solirubrobacter soli]|uniref:Na-translocating system protein MpsC family protein n=1 Tax=Solirubrobacter soli TaxID=363832 RepID=UPI00146C0911|nr:Na-translocating system protein MpsC family protein [Solirubrobacter soli]